MFLDELPTEIVTAVFLSLPDLSCVSSLASSCRRLYDIFHSSKRLSILSSAAEAEYGPVEDIVQVLTHNASQPAHVRRDVPLSDALLRDVVRVGRVAQKWAELYPYKKWKTDYANRRLLTDSERYVLRRAVYRLWLYDRAFHDATHTRTTRYLSTVTHERALLLHNFSTTQLAEMLDVHACMRDAVANNVCPSNGKIRQKFHKRFPESNHQLLFNIHLNYPPAPLPFAPDGWFHNSMVTSKYQSRLQPSRFHEPGAEGWGDEINHYYVVEDMMKLDPEQILFLRDKMPLKSQVEAYVKELGEWFVNNGETFSETLGAVMKQRGTDVEVLRVAVEEGDMGVATYED